MIAFLTVIYIGFLALLVKLKILKLTLWVKLSPIVWVVFLFVVLMIPLNFWAPMGAFRVYQNVIPIFSQVPGRVIDVPVKPLVPVTRGQVLYRIDPAKYQFQVDKLEALAADAGVNVAQLNEQLIAANAQVKQVRANLYASETDFDRRAREAYRATEAQVEMVEANLGVVRTNLERFERAAESEAVPRIQVDQARREVESLEAQLRQAEANARQAELNVEAGSDRVQAVQGQLETAEAQARQTRLAFEAQIKGVNPRLRSILADLDLARWQLGETVVRAPSRGYVIGLALSPGMGVAGIPAGSKMAFVEEDPKVPVALIRPTQVRNVKPGDEVEVALETQPGMIFRAEVEAVIDVTAQGQFIPSGNLPALVPEPSLPIAVKFRWVDDMSEVVLPGGAGGIAAIYTESGAVAHVIRKVMIRMETWLNYLR